MNNSAPNGTMFMKPDVLGFFENLSTVFKTVILHEVYIQEGGANLELFKI